MIALPRCWGRRCHCWPAAGLLVWGLLAVVSLTGSADAQSVSKPPPPPGRDPGGLAIAVLSAGIDYRDPEIARLLARDGEGEVIGWDAVDNDNRPFAEKTPTALVETGGTDMTRLVGGPGRRIVPVRIAADDPASIGRALAFVARTPATVIVMPVGLKIDWTTLAGPLVFTAARGMLVVVPVTPAGEGWPILRRMPGVILAAQADTEGPGDPDFLYVGGGNPGATVAGALAACWDRLAPLGDASGRKSAFLALVAARMSGGRDGECVPPTITLRLQAR